MSALTDENNKKWSAYASPPFHSIHFGNDQPSCTILRLDLIRSWASGNKYFKLKYVIKDALEKRTSTIVSKGGMFSNHLAALSEACSAFGIHLVAVIRSNGPDELNRSIQRLRKNGAEILYLAPSAYKVFGEEEALKLYPGSHFVPEGGLSEEGIKGSAEIVTECLTYSPTHVVIAGGTMCTACGLLAGMPETIKVIIIPALKGCGEDYISEILTRFKISPACSWEIWPEYHFGGFGKYDGRLIDFMTSFSEKTDVPLDPVYTGKMMFAIQQKNREGYFKTSDHILAIHTGGLQGIEGYRYRFPTDWGAYLSGAAIK